MHADAHHDVSSLLLPRYDHCEVSFNLDDGFEFFGGTVNVKSMLSVLFAGDAEFDTDNGYVGKGQFLLEIDLGIDSNRDVAPRSHPAFYSFTLIGGGRGTGALDGELIHVLPLSKCTGTVDAPPNGDTFFLTVTCKGDTFFSTVTCKGAFGSSTDNWLAGYSWLACNGKMAGATCTSSAARAALAPPFATLLPTVTCQCSPGPCRSRRRP